MLVLYLTILIIFLGYFTIIYGLWKFGIFKKYNISLFGPIIMWRTKRGRKFIDRLSHRRTLWRWYGNLGIALCTFSMIIMFFLLFLGAIVAISIRTDPIPPQQILVLPGLNPIIPLWYGIFALAVAIIVHEFSHGILARRVKIKLKSLGVLLFIVPIGAFVEPDEKQMEKINRRDRARIFSAGLTTNIILALICAAIFSWGFMASLQPVKDGILVLNVTEGAPAEEAGIESGMILTEVEYIDQNGTMVEHVDIKTKTDFVKFMDVRSSNDMINITAYFEHRTIQFNNITLADQYNYTNRAEDRGKGFLGIGSRGVGEFKESLAHPVMSAGDDVDERRLNIMQYFFLPMDLKSNLLPFHSPVTEAYEVTGPLAGLPNSVFWVLSNTFYYLFWINILLGIFNAIPAIPLDGGYVFKDGMNAVLSRLLPKMDSKKREMYINSLSVSLAFLILILIMMTFIGPYILKFL